MAEELSLPEQVLLLGLDDATGKVDEFWLEYGLEAAVLAELLVQGRLRLRDDHRLEVQDPTLTGDPLLDHVLYRIGESHRAHGVREWIDALLGEESSLRRRCADRLVERGILARADERYLWVFHRTTYPTQDARPESEERAQVRSALLGAGPVDDRVAALIALLHATEALDRVLTPDELSRSGARVEEISGDLQSRAPWMGALLSGLDAAMSEAVTPDAN